MKKLIVESWVMAAALTVSAQALAADPEATGSEPAAEGPAPAEAAAPTTLPSAQVAPAGDAVTVQDGVRFRFGVSGGLGFFTAASEVGSAKISCKYYGLDLRFGAQINNLIGVYAQPTLGYYTAGDGGALAAGGLLGMNVVADFTLMDHFFAGAGLGYTIYNNPGGVTPMLRVGGYPLMSRSDVKARRKGLMLGVDLRFTSLEGLKTIVMPTFNLGYEAF